MGERVMQKRYNLATPELIAKLIEVGAKTDTATRRNVYQYRVRVPVNAIELVNPLLTGTKMRKTHRAFYSFYSKDVWNCLRNSDARRKTYGHISVKTLHCGLPINAFKFSDGNVIKLCRNLACTKFDGHRQRVLRGGL